MEQQTEPRRHVSKANISLPFMQAASALGQPIVSNLHAAFREAALNRVMRHSAGGLDVAILMIST